MPIWYTLKLKAYDETSRRPFNTNFYHEVDLLKITAHRAEYQKVEKDGVQLEVLVREHIFMDNGSMYELADGEWDEIKALLNGQSRIGGQVVKVVE